MPEDVLFEVEHVRSRSEIASLLRDVADKLDGDDSLTLAAGGDSITVEVPKRPTFEIKVERERAHDADRGELGVEFELEWDEDDAGDGNGGDLRVE